MKIFISHSKDPDRELAYRVSIKLRAQRHTIFFDEDSLPQAQSYDERIRAAIRKANLFIYIASPGSIQPGRYAQTELKIAKQQWLNPVGHVLTVVIDGLDMECLDPYLRDATTALRPEGDIAADVANAVALIAEARRRRLGAYTAVLLATLSTGAVMTWRLLPVPLQYAELYLADQNQTSVVGTFNGTTCLMDKGSLAIKGCTARENCEHEAKRYDDSVCQDHGVISCAVQSDGHTVCFSNETACLAANRSLGCQDRLLAPCLDPRYNPWIQIKGTLFRMQRHEVTKGEYACFLGSSTISTDLNFPVTNLAIDDAKKYCDWIGGRLPTEEQWLSAIKGLRYTPIEPPRCPSPVGSSTEPATPAGFVDLFSNVEEYISSDDSDPTHKYVAGLSCARPLEDVKAQANAERWIEWGTDKSEMIGFRCAMTIAPQVGHP